MGAKSSFFSSEIRLKYFRFFTFDLEYLEGLQSSETLLTKMPQTFCFFSTQGVFLLAGTISFDEKSRQSAALFWFGLCDFGVLQIFYSWAVLQRTIVDSPSFFSPSSRKRLPNGQCPYNPFDEEVGGLDGFLYEAAQNFEVFSNIQD
jgi:hypothetical protein